jgi:phosphoribosylformylglycinamidine synthase
MIIHLDKVPTRQADMKPWEMLLSESQERMLIVGKKGSEDVIRAVFDKWDIHCVEIGEVTAGGRLEFKMHGETVADLPAESLVLGGGAPVYERDYSEPEYLKQIAAFNLADVTQPADLKLAAFELISLPNIASKRWVYEQYDSMVGTGNTGTNAPSDASVVRVHGSDKALAMTVDCNSRYVFADPYKGAMIAVSEAARNIVCSGGTPVGVTNCLNFGNPYNPEVYYQFVNAIKGMGEACRKFRTPVTGGNVSFYNQSESGPVYPTPTIGMVGVLDNISNKMTLGFVQPTDDIYLIGTAREDLGCSEYLHHLQGVTHSPAPYFDLEEEFAIQEAVCRLIDKKLIHSAHDVSEGGIFTTLLESAMPNGFGFTLETDTSMRKDAYLFGEGQSRVVVSVSHAFAPMLEAELEGVPHTRIGKVVADKSITVDEAHWGYLGDWQEAYDTAIEKLLK